MKCLCGYNIEDIVNLSAVLGNQNKMDSFDVTYIIDDEWIEDEINGDVCCICEEIIWSKQMRLTPTYKGEIIGTSSVVLCEACYDMIME